MDDEEGITSRRDVDEEWIREVEKKIDLAFEGSAVPMPSYVKDETGPKICKFTLHHDQEISRPRLVKASEFSRPIAVSIGPFHGLQKKISISNKAKWMFVYFVNYLYDLKPEDHLLRCLRNMKNRAADARSCYANSDLPKRFGGRDDHKIGKRSPKDEKNDKRFAEMLLLDSYFILFMLTIQIRKTPTGYTLMPMMPTNPTKKLLKLFRDDQTKFLDVVFDKDEIAPDLLIVDNQIPFFAIEELYKELKLEMPLHECALKFFETIHPGSARHCKDKNIRPPEFLHLLDLFHWSRVPQNKHSKLNSSPQLQLDSIDGAHRTPNAMGCRECAIIFEKEKPKKLDSINWARHTPNATELRESATMFEKKASRSSLDITFRRRWFRRIIGVLNIPELHIRDYSSFIFHNLIAFEMQPSSRSRCAMAFSALMRNLLRTEEDVKLLRQRGILASSSMSDGELVDLFECLSRLTENHEMPSDLCAVCHQVQSHHNHPVSRFCGSVLLQYFPNPLVTLSVFGATMLFILTLLQTIYAMISYYHS